MTDNREKPADLVLLVSNGHVTQMSFIHARNEQVRDACTHAILRATSDGPGRGQSPASAGSTARAQPQRVRSMVGAQLPPATRAARELQGRARARASPGRIQSPVGRAAGDRLPARAERARAGPGSQSPAGRVAGDRPPAWGPSTRKSQRGEGRLPRGRAAQRARSSAGAQHGALRADIQAAICAESGRKRPGASSGRLQPELRASCFRARAACGRRSQQSPCLISRCN